MTIEENKTAYVILESKHGTINTLFNRRIRVLNLAGIATSTTSFQTSANPYTPGEAVVGLHDDARIVSLALSAPKMYRAQMIRMFAAGQEGRMTVNWGGVMRFIEYVVQSSDILQNTVTRELQVLLTLRCPDVFFNDMNDFGENIAGVVPMIIFPNLWYIGDDFVTDYRLFESAAALENRGDVPIGIKLRVTAANGTILNPVIYLSDSVYFRVFQRMNTNDVLEISTVRREKYVRLNGENILNRTDMSSTFFEIEPGVHKIYYDAEDGMENMNVFLYRRPQYLGV